MGLDKLHPPTKYGVSDNEEDWEIVDDFESAIYQGLEMVLEQCSISPGEENPISIWIGTASKYNAAWFLFEAMTGWSTMEERAQEIFYEESLCENDRAFQFPDGPERSNWYYFLMDCCEKMVKKFGIDINYYEVQEIKKYVGVIFWRKGRHEPQVKVSIEGELYETNF